MISNKHNQILKFDIMPIIKPIDIDKSKIKCFSTTRQWVIEQDWNYKLYDKSYVIKRGFQFDGASVPSCLKICRSPTGILFMASLIHDWGYQKASLLQINNNGAEISVIKTRKEIDTIFKEINSDSKYFKSITYYVLKLFGWRAWRAYRKIERDLKIEMDNL